ncbi:hypothetical protein OF83DRAFT_1175063 [Amylostereum chailletii]|nr:hypothetical protein OF83DRAFT_1175063 [Amylostereum chailletii]
MSSFPDLLNTLYNATHSVASIIRSLGSTIVVSTLFLVIAHVAGSLPLVVFACLAMCAGLYTKAKENWDVILDHPTHRNKCMPTIQRPSSHIPCARHNCEGRNVNVGHPPNSVREAPPPWRIDDRNVRPFRPRPTAVSPTASTQTTLLPQHPVPSASPPNPLPNAVLPNVDPATPASSGYHGQPRPTARVPPCMFFDRKFPYARCFVAPDPCSPLLTDPNPDLSSTCASPEVGDLLVCGKANGQVHADHLDKMRVFDKGGVWRKVQLGDQHPTEVKVLNRPSLDRLTWVKPES